MPRQIVSLRVESFGAAFLEDLLNFCEEEVFLGSLQNKRT